MSSRNYPKHWDGYISLGGKMAGELDAVGLPFLTKSTHDGTLVRKHDFMYTVTGGEEDQFVASGRIRKNGKNRDIMVVAPDYRQGFVTKEVFFGSYVGKNKKLLVTQTDLSTVDVFHDYTTSPPDPFNRVARQIYTLVPDPLVVSGNVRSRRGVGFSIPFSVVRISTNTGTTFFPVAPRVGPLRHLPDGSIDYYVTTLLTDVSADRFGAPVNTVGFARINSEDKSFDLFALPTVFVPAPELRSAHYTPIGATVGPGRLYLFTMTEWAYPRADGPMLFPIARLFYTEDAATTWSVADVTPIVLDDIPWVPTTLAEQLNSAVFSSGWYEALNMIWRSALAVAIGNNEALLTFVYPRRNPSSPTSWNGQLAFRTYLLSGGVMTRLNEEAGPGTAFSYFQDMVYLGQDIVLAKRTYGYPGTGHDVEWVISADRGVSWTVVPAEGLPNLPPNRKNQFFGNMTVVQPVSDKFPGGVVLLTAYDPAERGYFVYGSEDLGATWRRRGLLSRTETFFRVDQMLSDDGGNNFAHVQFVGSTKAPAPYNPAIPDLLGAP